MDERVVVIGHLFVIGAQEADSLVVVPRGGVMPCYRLVAVVGDVLVGRSTQEPQESHLDHPDGIAVRIHIGKLWETERGDKKDTGNTRLGNSGRDKKRRREEPFRQACEMSLRMLF